MAVRELIQLRASNRTKTQVKTVKCGGRATEASSATLFFKTAATVPQGVTGRGCCTAAEYCNQPT